METIDCIVEKMGVADVDQKLGEFLIDGILYVFQEQTGEDLHDSERFRNCCEWSWISNKALSTPDLWYHI